MHKQWRTSDPSSLNQDSDHPMTSIIAIDHEKAASILDACLKEVGGGAHMPTHRHRALIESIIMGEHLTYRYILITSLLAKATHEGVHTLALQAGAQVEGAFDARSLCHKVIVPSPLNRSLGRSNEPFLNKPARYKTLSRDNPVRRGQDLKILEACILVLSSIESASEARLALTDAIHFAAARTVPELPSALFIKSQHIRNYLWRLGESLVSQSCEGESCALLVGVSLRLMGFDELSDFEVRVHPANQAGTSSREVLDVDIYYHQKLCCAVEVKDKVYEQHDVEHAARKAASAGLESFIFVRGPRAAGPQYDEGRICDVRDLGAKPEFINVMQLFSLALALGANRTSATDFWNFFDDMTNRARIRYQTKQHALRAARASGMM